MGETEQAQNRRDETHHSRPCCEATGLSQYAGERLRYLGRLADIRIRKAIQSDRTQEGERTVTERIFPSSPYICKLCGIGTDGSILIEGKAICKKCYKRYHLEETTGFTVEELYGE